MCQVDHNIHQADINCQQHRETVNVSISASCCKGINTNRKLSSILTWPIVPNLSFICLYICRVGGVGTAVIEKALEAQITV